MPNRVTAYDFQRRFGTTFQRVRSGEHLIVTYDGVDTAAIIPVEAYRLITEASMTEDPAFNLNDQGHIQPAPQALVQALLTVHHGDRAAAARALLAHIQAEQQALALLLANEGQP